MTGYVYAVRCGKFVKIGWSEDPLRRAVKINSDNPRPCTLMGYFPATRADEAKIQTDLREYRTHSEWFRWQGPVIAAVKAFPNKPEPVRRYSSGRKMYREHQRSMMRRFASRHGDLTKWAREIGVRSLSSWRVVPLDRLDDVERVTGISRQLLRPDLFGTNASAASSFVTVAEGARA